jgi:hypothetical protein
VADRQRNFSTLNADEKSNPLLDVETLADRSNADGELDADEKSKSFLAPSAGEELAADEGLAADEESRGFWASHVDRKLFSALDADKKSKGFLARGPTSGRKNPFDRGRTKRVEPHRGRRHYEGEGALYARIFSTLAAGGKLAADKKSKGFLARGPALGRKSPFDQGRTSQQRGQFCLFFAIS